MLSVVIPAQNEEGCIESTVEHLHVELRVRGISTRSSWWTTGAPTTRGRSAAAPGADRRAAPVRNEGAHGFGRAVVRGLITIAGMPWSS